MIAMFTVGTIDCASTLNNHNFTHPFMSCGLGWGDLILDRPTLNHTVYTRLTLGTHIVVPARYAS